MKTILRMKLYGVIGFAILGIRIVVEYLSLVELLEFFGAVIVISLAGTALHGFFESRANKTGKNAASSPSFLVQMIVITMAVSGGLYFLISYISGDFSIGFDIVFYVLFIPAVILMGIYFYYKIAENEYNQKLKELQNKQK